nr:hypothetical protein [uncultured Merdimonas sp.]
MAKKHGSKILDITGKRFGRLTALYPTEKRDQNGSVYWHCLCDCGNTTEISESKLMHGNYKSCGCLKTENQKNIAGQLHIIDGTCVEILENRKHRKDNTSGFRGVYQMKNKRYRVDIGFKGKRFYLGTFQNYDDAVQARLKAEEMVHDGFLQAYYVWKKRADADPEWGRKNPLKFDVSKENGNLVIQQKTGLSH